MTYGFYQYDDRNDYDDYEEEALEAIRKEDEGD